MNGKFVFSADVVAAPAGEGVTRKVLAHSEKMMIVEVTFEAGAVGAEHTHPHEQVTYIASGKFRFTNDGEAREVSAGDTIRFAPGAPHGTVCLSHGSVVDVFAPARMDFL